AIVLNRAESAPPMCEQRILQALNGGHAAAGRHGDALIQTLSTMQQEHELRSTAAQRAIDNLQSIAPQGTDVIRLPFVHRSEPSAIVLALAQAWQQSGADV
ncbi:MAG: hypothetical protein ACOC1F_07890, partial [Myxococcota bacterium]